jgi:hypothetical protein
MDIGFLAILWKQIRRLKKQDLVQPDLAVPPGWTEAGYLNDEEKRLYSVIIGLRDDTGSLSDKILRECREPTESEDVMLQQAVVKLEALRAVLFSSVAIRLKVFGKEVGVFRHWQVAWRNKREANGILVLEPVEGAGPTPSPDGFKN